ALLENPADATGFPHVSTLLGEDVAEFADGAVLVIGGHFDHDRHAAWSIALISGLFVDYAGQLTGSALDRPLDVVGGHVLGFGIENDSAQARVGIRIAAAVAGSYGQFLDDPGEDAAALCVGG